MAISTEAVANRLLDLADAAGAPVSSMKLQKLVYFSHGWYLALTDDNLIPEPVQAWKYGPVICSLYHEFKGFGNKPIGRRVRQLRYTRDGDVQEYEPSINDEADNPDFIHTFLGLMWERYGSFSAIQLSKMTHREGTPWHTVSARFGFDPPPGVNIPNDLIKAHFKARLQSVESE